MSNILVSIIIPTYNDWNRLSLCLDALGKQTLSKDEFEVIVVNNNPKDSVPKNFSLSRNVSILTEKQAGSYAARNAGIKIAKGEIIGFTDSDCIPDINWIKNAIDHFRLKQDCTRIAGKINIFFKSQIPTKAELYDKLYAFNQREYVQNSGTGVTANLFAYKHVFEAVGLFNEGLLSGGDFLWGVSAHRHGFKIDYVENVIVNHPARRNLKELIKKEKRVGGNQALFLRKRNAMINFGIFLKDVVPRLGSAIFIFTQGKHLKLHDKLYLYVIRQFLLGVRAHEKFRVQIGKKANRA
jgi:GT2 family glycosyltransferase